MDRQTIALLFAYKVSKCRQVARLIKTKLSALTSIWIGLNIGDVNAIGASEKEKLKGMEDAYLQMGSWLEKFKKKKITCYLLDKEVKGYKVSYESDTAISYHIYASGVVNGQAVSVILNLNKEPVTNADIPEFARQIVRLSK